MKFISLQGARLHNLKNVHADFPEKAITVVCGPSGSGKSSLAFDTLHGECRRRYLETLSPFAVQLLGGKKYIPLDSALNLIPSIAISKASSNVSEKANALSLAGIDDSFFTLWANLASPVCEICKEKTISYSREEILTEIANLEEGSRVQILAPVPVKENSLKELAAFFLPQGFSRVLADKKALMLSDLTPQEEKIIPQTFEIVIDRIIIKENVRTRISEAIDTCFKITHDFLEIEYSLPKDSCQKRKSFSTTPICKNGHRTKISNLEASRFSPYNKNFVCKTCNGKGFINEINETCPTCNGLHLQHFLLESEIDSISYQNLIQKNFKEFYSEAVALFENKISEPLKRTFEIFKERTSAVIELGLSYLSPSRHGKTLSTGELERLRLVSVICGYLNGMLFCLDEIAAGLDKEDSLKVFEILKKIKEKGNTIVLMEHNPELIYRSDWIIEMGEGAGTLGGKILNQGKTEEILNQKNSPTGNWLKHLKEKKEIYQKPKKVLSENTIPVRNFSQFGIQKINADFPLEKLSIISGASGSGKSTLLYHFFEPEFHKGSFKKFGIEELSVLSTGSFQGNKRSFVASAIQIYTPLRELFSNLPDSKIRGYTASKFGIHLPGGRCETCKGEGVLLDSFGMEASECPVCLGKRFRDEVLEIRFKSLSMADILNLSVENAMYLFEAFPKLYSKLHALVATGLGYLKLGQSTSNMSGGELSRLRLAIALSKTNPKKTLYLFDEPARGLHEVDIQKLLLLFKELCKQGHTIIAIEHAVDFIYAADYVLELKR